MSFLKRNDIELVFAILGPLTIIGLILTPIFLSIIVMSELELKNHKLKRIGA